MKKGVKHLIECHCILPQFKSHKDPSFHKFIVFSIIDETDRVVTKCVQCNNCGVIHRVYDIAKSEIISGNESNAAVVSIDDIKHSISPTIVSVLESYKCDISTWEYVLFILENSLWKSFVILTAEIVNDVKQGKYMIINGESNIKIESYSSRISISI